MHGKKFTTNRKGASRNQRLMESSESVGVSVAELMGSSLVTEKPGQTTAGEETSSGNAPFLAVHPRGYPIASLSPVKLIPDPRWMNLSDQVFHEFKTQLKFDMHTFTVSNQSDIDETVAKRSSAFNIKGALMRLANIATKSLRPGEFYLRDFCLYLGLDEEVDLAMGRQRAGSFQQFISPKPGLIRKPSVRMSNKRQTLKMAVSKGQTFFEETDFGMKVLELPLSLLHDICFPKKGKDFSLSFYMPHKADRYSKESKLSKITENVDNSESQISLVTFQMESAEQAEATLKYVLKGLESLIGAINTYLKLQKAKPQSKRTQRTIVKTYRLRFDLAVILYGFSPNETLMGYLEEFKESLTTDADVDFWEGTLASLTEQEMVGGETDDYLDKVRQDYQESSVV